MRNSATRTIRRAAALGLVATALTLGALAPVAQAASPDRGCSDLWCRSTG